jgi:hypothetical protein
MYKPGRKEILKRKLINIFPNKIERPQASQILERYGVESCEVEHDRVRLAILKLSCSSLASLKKNTQLAKIDYRDILSLAEYPKQSKSWLIPNGPKKQKMIEDDLSQYENWLYND